MSLLSNIEWTDATWNPVTGCTEVSPGCDHCYAKIFAERWRGIAGHPYEQGFDVRLWPERLELPLKWKKPRRIFTNSMSDLFHVDVPDEFIFRVFDIMVKAEQHVFQLLTKRPSRLLNLSDQITKHTMSYSTKRFGWPSNIWVGVSVETIQYEWRVEKLRHVPAAIRFISAEPLLASLVDLDLQNIDWLIAGGESGPKHRPCDPQWIRELRDKCLKNDVSFFFKQWGGRYPKLKGRELDNRTWDEFPVHSNTPAQMDLVC